METRLRSSFFDGALDIVIGYLVGLRLAILIGNAVFYLAQSVFASTPRIVISPIVAGIVEPIFSKFGSAPLLILWIRNVRPENIEMLRASPLTFGVIGGAVVGIVEAIGKIVVTTGTYAGVDSVTGGVLVAIALHTFDGGLVGNAVFRPRDDRAGLWQNPLTATALAVLIHVSWNGYNLIRLAESIA